MHVCECRTETVVEKLLAGWLSICMYDSLRLREPGKALFLLYHAVKRQTEKGPVDVVTAESRYCLSEDRLLHENVDYTVLVGTPLPRVCDILRYHLPVITLNPLETASNFFLCHVFLRFFCNHVFVS